MSGFFSGAAVHALVNASAKRPVSLTARTAVYAGRFAGLPDEYELKRLGAVWWAKIAKDSGKGDIAGLAPVVNTDIVHLGNPQSDLEQAFIANLPAWEKDPEFWTMVAAAHQGSHASAFRLRAVFSERWQQYFSGALYSIAGFIHLLPVAVYLVQQQNLQWVAWETVKEFLDKSIGLKKNPDYVFVKQRLLHHLKKSDAHLATGNPLPVPAPISIENTWAKIGASA